MRRINVIISDRAREVLDRHQRKKNLPNLDETLDDYILSQPQDKPREEK